MLAVLQHLLLSETELLFPSLAESCYSNDLMCLNAQGQQLFLCQYII